MNRIAIVLAVLLIPQVAYAATKFDLKCTGTLTDAGTGETKPWSNNVVIDLDRNEWCSADCSKVEKIKEVLADRIVLSDSTGLTKVGPSIDRAIINRKDGSVEWTEILGKTVVQTSLPPGYTLGADIGIKASGVCKAAAFTGFPKTKF